MTRLVWRAETPLECGSSPYGATAALPLRSHAPPQLENALEQPEASSIPETPQHWHHAPAHAFEPGAFYMVTAGTYGKLPHFRGDARLRQLQDALFNVADAYGWQLQAWVVFANHYHFIARAPQDASTLQSMIKRLHSQTARKLNRMDDETGRRVWFQYWDTCLTYETSYLARLKYVHTNPVRHGVVPVAEQYPFCSARWFRMNAEDVFRRKVESFRCDRVNVRDEF